MCAGGRARHSLHRRATVRVLEADERARGGGVRLTEDRGLDPLVPKGICQLGGEDHGRAAAVAGGSQGTALWSLVRDIGVVAGRCSADAWHAKDHVTVPLVPKEGRRSGAGEDQQGEDRESEEHCLTEAHTSSFLEGLREILERLSLGRVPSNSTPECWQKYSNMMVALRPKSAVD